MDGREHRWFILAVSIVPLLATVAAMVLLWNRALGVTDLVLLVVMYAVCALGISSGYHRLLAHRSFEAAKPVEGFLVVAGVLAAQGPPIIWAAHHRRHHRVADKPGDPHSPHLDFPPGILGALRGLWHAHLGWLFDTELTSEPMRYCPDLVRQRWLRVLSERFVLIVLAGILLPGVLGLALSGGSPRAFLTGVLWGGLVRIFLVNHLTYAVNSVGHYFGRRRFPTTDESRNVFWLALPSFGEAWHNNHHAFPRSARHGMRWWEVDLSAVVIWTLERVGLAWNVVRIDPERMSLKEGGISRVPGVATSRTELLARQQELVPLADRAPGSAISPVDVE